MRPRFAPLIIFAFSSACAFGQTNPWFEHGTKANGKPVGVWTYFDSPGNKVLVYDYVHDSILYIRKDTIKSLVKQVDQWSLLDTDYPARVKGSYESLYAYLQAVITNYTRELTKNSDYLQARVYVGFEIDYWGKLTKVEVLNSDHSELVRRLTAALKGAPFEWLPAKRGNNAFTSLLAIPIVFCSDCQYQLAGNPDSEDLPLECPVLPQIIIQQSAGKTGYLADRSAFVKDKRRTGRMFYDPGEEAEFPSRSWSTDDKKVTFVHQNNFYEYDTERGTTKQLTHTIFKKSDLIRLPDGWLYTQLNSFGVAEIFFCPPDFGKTTNLSREIKWPEHLMGYDAERGRVYFVGSKGKGKSLYSINLRNGQKDLIVYGTLGHPYEYLLVDHQIVHLELNREGRSICLVDTTGHHEALTSYRHGVNLLGQSTDNRSIFYSIDEESVETYYQYNLENRKTTMLPLVDAELIFENGQYAIFERSIGSYPTKTTFYKVDLSTGDLSTVGTVDNLEQYRFPNRNLEAVMTLKNDIYHVKLDKSLEAVLLVKKGKWPIQQKTGNLVFFFGSKNNLPYTINIATKQVTAVPLP